MKIFMESIMGTEDAFDDGNPSNRIEYYKALLGYGMKPEEISGITPMEIRMLNKILSHKNAMKKKAQDKYIKTNNAVLKGILNNWIKAMAQFIKATNGEILPWYFNERCDISLVSGAVWLSGGAGIEEMTVLKKKAKGSSLGRADLVFSYRSHIYYCEAKSFRFSRGNNSLLQAQKEQRQFLTEATNDLKKVEIRYKKLALFFQIPQFTTSDITKVDEWKNAARRFKGTAVAYYFPKKSIATDDGKIWPGVILYIDEINTNR